jgi:CVNH domain
MSMFQKSKTVLKTANILFLISLGAFFIKPDTALAGGSINTCKSHAIFPKNDSFILEASCKNKNGEYANTELTISDYIANYGGSLSWAKPVGAFQKSCRNITLLSREGSVQDSLLLMQAECSDGKGGWKKTGLNLEDKISNQNGVLAVDR